MVEFVDGSWHVVEGCKAYIHMEMSAGPNRGVWIEELLNAGLVLMKQF